MFLQPVKSCLSIPRITGVHRYTQWDSALNFVFFLNTTTLKISFLNLFLGLITTGSMEVKANGFYSPCQHYNVTVALLLDPMKEYNTTCTPEAHPGKPTGVEDPPWGDSLNHTCGIMENTSNCTHVSLHLAIDVKCKFERKGERNREVGCPYIKLRRGSEIHQKSNSWKFHYGNHTAPKY